MNVGIYIYDEAEVLDFSGPFEVFSTASRICPSEYPFNVFMISESGKTITARGGYKVKPTYAFHNHPEIHVLIVVGGVHAQEMKKPKVVAWIKKEADKAKLVASVCTGVFLLAEAGILTTQNVTTHWEDISDLRHNHPRLNVLETKRWVEEGNIVTSGGISAGIDMSLYLVSKLSSPDLAKKTAKQMEYTWATNS